MRNGRRAGSVIEWVSSSFSLPACYQTPLMSFNRPAAAWCLVTPLLLLLSGWWCYHRTQPLCPAWAAPAHQISLPCSLSAPGWVSLLSAWYHQHFLYWAQVSTRGSQELVNSLGVINTPEYNMELINRCYYLQWAAQAQDSNEGVCEVSVWGLMLMWGILLSLTNVVLRTVCKWAILFSSPNTAAMKRSIECKEKDKQTSEKKIKRL